MIDILNPFKCKVLMYIFINSDFYTRIGGLANISPRQQNPPVALCSNRTIGNNSLHALMLIAPYNFLESIVTEAPNICIVIKIVII